MNVLVSVYEFAEKDFLGFGTTPSYSFTKLIVVWQFWATKNYLIGFFLRWCTKLLIYSNVFLVSITEFMFKFVLVLRCEM